MCTATWLRSAAAAGASARLHLFFNRDESLAREPAGPPRRFAREGIRYIAPTDGRASGTWILATELGLTVALLNRSGASPTHPAPASRGQIPPLLAPARGPGELTRRTQELDLTPYAPFRLLALWRAPESASLAVWDGRELRFEALPAATGIVCSSGLGDEAATAAREATWRSWHAARPAWGPEDHRQLHRSHDPTPHAFSVCMHRSGFATVSMVELELAADGCRLVYHPGSPCAPGAAQALALDSSAATGRP